MMTAWLVATQSQRHVAAVAPAAELEAQNVLLQQEADALAPRSTGWGEEREHTPSPDPERHARLQAQIAANDAQAQAIRAQARHSSSVQDVQQLAQLAQIDDSGSSQHLNVLTLSLDGVALPAAGEPRSVLTNLDADGYLERAQWVSANQALLGVDLNGDGRLSGTELLSQQQLSQLDANGDGQLDQNDPAYGALRLWNDINGDGRSAGAGEVQSLSAAGISTLDYADGALQVGKTDGSAQALQAQTLSGDVLGVNYSLHKDAKGVLLAQNDEWWALAA